MPRQSMPEPTSARKPWQKVNPRMTSRQKVSCPKRQGSLARKKPRINVPDHRTEKFLSSPQHVLWYILQK